MGDVKSWSKELGNHWELLHLDSCKIQTRICKLQKEAIAKREERWKMDIIESLEKYEEEIITAETAKERLNKMNEQNMNFKYYISPKVEYEKTVNLLEYRVVILQLLGQLKHYEVELVPSYHSK